MADTTFQSVLPALKAVDLGDGTYGMAVNFAQPITLTNPTINGTISTTGLTMPAFTLGGKLTAGANEIEGSNFDINGGTIDGVTITDPTINGTIATTGLTLPAVALGGAVSGNAQTISNANITVGAGRTLDVSAGTLTLADNQISGDKVEGGTINAITINGLTLGGNITSGGYGITAGANDFTVAHTVYNKAFVVTNTNDGSLGGQLYLGHVTTSLAVDDAPGMIRFRGTDGAGAQNFTWAQIEPNVTNIGDGTEAAKLVVFLANAGAANEALRLSGAGGLSVDADIGTGDDPVALFDSIPSRYGVDDAQFLVQSVVNKETLPKFCEIGVMERKDTGSGYMLNYQKAQYFTWGAIKALYERIETLERGN